ncbi:3-hydroxybutyryl-CoA dehydrogenase [Methanoculleus sp. FWC-SCC1]|uniref:3-hydroxybutyryl-CoA dehydrogenase n=2 Tax=Methanoculleus frigidifontis TaxID=2584085 RepID=A0ABT8MCK6_9EURY|nr:3-hydroxybutyryl-CoA dehydrogenase [Methanoculleus sp. FWC-SCC1]
MKYCCLQCHKCWNHPVEKCIFCGQGVTPVEETQYRVIGTSEVFVPSTGNEKVPYFVNILEDLHGHKKIEKSFQKYEIGDIIDIQQNDVQRDQIGVIGTGLLGSQIAAYLIQYGYPTVLKTRSDDSAKKAVSKIQKQIAKRMSDAETEAVLQSLTITTDYSGLADCDVIIEAAAEDMDIKREIFHSISQVCKPSTILATNSSSLSIDDLAGATDRPEKCIGMHFFNPVHRMDLVEVVIGSMTSDATKDSIIGIVTALNKKPIIVQNSPGYVVNRLLLPQINEAVLLLEEGVASKEDIDSAIKLGLNHPMGPFQLADFIGLDICLSILEVLYQEFNNPKYKPAQLLSDLIEQGKLGFKSGEGFYTYGKVNR